MDEIINELVSTNRFLDEDYKNSKYYREYLDKVCADLKAETTKLKKLDPTVK